MLTFNVSHAGIRSRMGNSTTTVLVVDREEHCKKILKDTLVEWDMRVTSTANAREALCLIDEALPDIIILDACIPDVDCLELCKRLRSRLQTRSIPLVIVSSARDVRSKVRALQSGADDYIIKPYSLKEFVARLRAVLRSYL